MKLKIYAFIFARKNSKRLKNKNIKKINNKELITYSINLAKKIKSISKIFVSSDSSKIISIAKREKVYFINRPHKLCRDNSNEILSWQHAINFLKDKNDNFDIFLSLPATAPLRSIKDVQKLIKTFIVQKSDLTICVSKTHRLPAFNLVQLSNSGKVKLTEIKKGNYSRNNMYDITTIGYISTPNYILNNKNIFSGNVKSILIPRERSLDIDDAYDFKIAKLLLKK